MTETQRLSDIIRAGAPMQLHDIICLELQAWRAGSILEWMRTGQRYYEVDNDIKRRVRTAIGENGRLREVQNVANNRLAHGFIRELVDQKTQYLLGKPYSLQGENERHLTVLTDQLGPDFLRLLRRLAKDAITQGIAWLHPCYDDEGNFSLRRMEPQEMIPLWRDAAHTELDAMIRVYDAEQYEARDKRVITKVEFWAALKPTEYYIFDGNLHPDPERPAQAHFAALAPDGTEEARLWERLPFVPLKYNDEEFPLVRFIKSLIDAYDRITSDDANLLEDQPNSVFVLRNYDGADLGEFRRNMAAYRAVKVSDDGGVDTLDPKLDISASGAYLERLRRDIYAFGRGVDTRNEKLAGATSGVALRHEYAQLDMDCNQLESELQAFFVTLLWFLDAHFAGVGIGDFDGDEVTIICNRDIIINEESAIDAVTKTVGVTSLRTVLEQIPWITDVEDELRRIDEERTAAMNEAIDAMGGNYGTRTHAPPDDDDEEN